MPIEVIYTTNDLSAMHIRITRVTAHDNVDAVTYDLHIAHRKSISNEVMINVTSMSCVLDVLRMALTLYKIEDLIDEDRKQAVIKGVRKALGYKS